MTIEDYFSQSQVVTTIDDIIKTNLAGQDFWAVDPVSPAYLTRVDGFRVALEQKYGLQIKAYNDLEKDFGKRYDGALETTQESTTGENSTKEQNMETNVDESVAVNSNTTTPYDLINNIDTQNRNKNDSERNVDTTNETTSNTQITRNLDHYMRDMDAIRREYLTASFMITQEFSQKWIRSC